MNARASLPFGSHDFDAANRVRFPRWIAVFALTFIGGVVAGFGGVLAAGAAEAIRTGTNWNPSNSAPAIVVLGTLSLVGGFFSLVVVVPVGLLARGLVLWRAWIVSTSLTMLTVAAMLDSNFDGAVVYAAMFVACASLVLMRFSSWRWPKRGGFAWLGDPVWASVNKDSLTVRDTPHSIVGRAAPTLAKL
jgi:hypothetical protein